MEEWRDVFEFSGRYQVSDLGRIRSLNYNKTGKIQILCQRKTITGYLGISLYKNKKAYSCLVQRLVARAFPEICGEWFEGCQISHENDIKTDNRAVNLKVCSASYNMRHNDLQKRHRISYLGRVAKYSEDNKILEVFKNTTEAAKDAGVCRGYMSRCLDEEKNVRGFIYRRIDIKEKIA